MTVLVLLPGLDGTGELFASLRRRRFGRESRRFWRSNTARCWLGSPCPWTACERAATDWCRNSWSA